MANGIKPDVNAPNFAAWSNENLANFAREAYWKMQEQHETIQQLQQDLKEAIAAYRKQMWENSK